MLKNPRYQAVRLGPDKRPVNGTVLAEARTADELDHLWKPGEVVICWTYDAPPPRKLSAASLGSVRRKRLWRRLRTKHPLLAPELYTDELKARPDHYDAENASPADTAWTP